MLMPPKSSTPSIDSKIACIGASSGDISTVTASDSLSPISPARISTGY